MHFIKRGWLSLTRRKGKAIILFAVIFILGNVMAGAVSIRQASTNVEKVIKQQLGSTATVDLDYKAVEKAYTEDQNYKLNSLPIDLIKKIGESTYVKYYDYNLTTMVGKGDLKPFEQEEKNGLETITAGGTDFTLKGVQYNNVLDFVEKKAKLIEGRAFTEEEIEKNSKVAIISKKVAEANNLKIGDKLAVANDVYDYSTGLTETSEPIASRDLGLEVIGIFEPEILQESKSEKNSGSSSFEKDFLNTTYQNTMYVPNGVAESEMNFQNEELDKVLPEEMKGNNEASYIPVYVLKNTEMSETFKKETEPLIPEPYKLTSSTDEYDSIAAPIKSMEKLSTYVLIATIGASLLIVSLVVLLFLRDRKHEFGVYLSLGEKRARVVGQIVFEVVVIAFLSLALSVFSGNILAGNLSKSMIQNQIEAQAEQEANSGNTQIMLNSNLTTNVTEDDVSESYQVKLTPGYLTSFFGLGILTILGATIIPMVYLIRLNPKKIML